MKETRPQINMSSDEQVFGSAFPAELAPCHHSIELNRIRNSFSFKFGNLITNSMKKPWLIPVFPFKLVSIFLTHGKRRVKENPESFELKDNTRDCIVFFSSNNPTSKEFLRVLSVARMMKRINPKQEIVFTSVYPLSESIVSGGISVYSIPRRHEFADMGSSTWNSMIESTLKMAFNVHKPNMFLFDGKYPFRGMLNAIPPSKMMKIWMHRAPFIKSMNESILQSIDQFDVIIQENDIFNNEDTHLVSFNSDLVNCDPITPLPYDPLNKESIRHNIDIKGNEVVIYIELGIEIIERGEIEQFLKSLALQKGLKLIFSNNLENYNNKNGNNNVQIHSLHQNIDPEDIDFAITTGEYNLLNDLLMMNIPALCLVNEKILQQVVRSEFAAESGCVISIPDNSPERVISAAIERMLDENVRARMKTAGGTFVKPNGAAQVADWILTNKPIV
jgi:hypothetical protein